MIRFGTHGDINAILAIGQKIINESQTYDGEIDKIKASRVLRRAINDKNMELFVAEKAGQVAGFLLAIKDEHWFSRSQYGTDLAFCVLPEHAEQGVWLFRRFMRWCKQHNLSMTMGLSTGMDVNGRTGMMYEAHGLHRVGGIYATIKKVEK